MNRKRGMLIFSILLVLFLSGCPSFYSEYDIHYVHYKNDSSHNIFIQYFLDGDFYTQWNNYDGAEGKVYRFTVDELQINEKYFVGISSNYATIDKILIIDSDTHKLLRKIEDSSYLLSLAAEKRIEKGPHETVTYYDHHFIITDEFLNGE